MELPQKSGHFTSAPGGEVDQQRWFSSGGFVSLHCNSALLKTGHGWPTTLPIVRYLLFSVCPPGTTEICFVSLSYWYPELSVSLLCILWVQENLTINEALLHTAEVKPPYWVFRKLTCSILSAAQDCRFVFESEFTFIENSAFCDPLRKPLKSRLLSALDGLSASEVYLDSGMQLHFIHWKSPEG